MKGNSSVSGATVGNFSKEWERIGIDSQKIISSAQSALPVKVGVIATSLGLTLKKASLAAGISGEIKSDNGSFIIRVNRHDASTRQRFTVAHEIAHYLLHRDLIGDGIVDDILYRSSLSGSMEAEANRLAADIVMPWHLLNEFLRSNKTLSVEQRMEKLALAADVSITAIKIRLGKI